MVELYGVDPDELLPGRHELVVDLDQRELAAAGHTQPLAGSAPTADEVLASYLSLVYTLRSTAPGTPLSLRQGDLDVLARALALATPEVEHRLRDLMAEPAAEVRRRVLVAAGPRAGAGGRRAGGGVRGRGPGRLQPLVRPRRARRPTARIGTAEVQTRNPDGSAGTQHTRAPMPTPPTRAIPPW